MNYLNQSSQERIEIETWRTGIFVKVMVKNPTKTIGYRADIDGLPIKEETELPFHQRMKTNMHACGHDFHMSIALGVLTYFVEQPNR